MILLKKEMEDMKIKQDQIGERMMDINQLLGNLISTVIKMVTNLRM